MLAMLLLSYCGVSLDKNERRVRGARDPADAVMIP